MKNVKIIWYKGIESLQSNVVDLKYFQLRILLDKSLKYLRFKVAKILELENLGLWQRLNSFIQ